LAYANFARSAEAKGPGDAGIVNEDVPRGCFLGHQLKGAVRLVFIIGSYDSVVQIRGARRSGLNFLHGSEEQRDERQHADPAHPRAATDTCDRGLDLEPTGFRHLAGDKCEIASNNVDQGWVRRFLTGKLFQDYARVVRNAKNSVVDEVNRNSAIGGGLDYVASENRLADFLKSKNTVRPRHGYGTDEALDLSYDSKRYRTWLRVKTTSRTAPLIGLIAKTQRPAPSPTLRTLLKFCDNCRAR
jgi:hypothetical protein